MKPPYDIIPEILKLVSSISEKIGAVNAHHLSRPSTQLRKQNRIKTIQATLEIEGNTLTEEQITAIIENKRVIGPQKDILEVNNAIAVYEQFHQFKVHSEASFLKAHRQLLSGLIANPGKYRQQGVGIVKGNKLEHVPPPHKNVPYLMNDLFQYLKDKHELTLIKSCVFHYELTFIHPFLDGNGRMSRLWQNLILMSEYTVFEFLPLETIIRNRQREYYQALSDSDKIGKSTPFIVFMLEVIDQALEGLLTFNNRILKDTDRLAYFLSMGMKTFSRKDYMNVFKDMSTATASRDLKKGVELKLFISSGEKNKTMYSVD